MKQIVWYLPSGSGGMAAFYKANTIKNAVRDWAAKHAPAINTQLDYYSENGLRYCALRLLEEYATLFALTWDNTNTRLHYEYINDYLPQIPTK